MTFELDESGEVKSTHYHHFWPDRFGRQMVTCKKGFHIFPVNNQNILAGNMCRCDFCGDKVALRSPDAERAYLEQGTLRLVRELFLKRDEE